MKKKLLGLGLTVSSIAVLAGCSSSAIPELVVADDLDTSKKITIEFWHQSTLNDDGSDPYQDYCDEFNKEYPNITVVPTTKESYSALSTAVEAGLAARKYPNLTLGYSNNFVEYMTVNAVADLTGFIEHEKYGLSDEDIEDFKGAGFWADNQVYDADGTMYSMSLAKSSEVMYVNMTLLTETLNLSQEAVEAKLATWEGVYSLSQALKDADSSVYQWHHDTTANWAITLLNQAGVDYTSINSDGEGVIEFLDSSETEAKNVFNKYLLGDYNGLASIRSTSGAYGSGQLMDQKWDSSTSSLVASNPSVWMNIGSSSAGSYYDNHTFDLQVFPVPQMETEGSSNYAVLQGPSMAMLVHADEQENLATWLFMQYLTSTETSVKIAADTGYMPVRASSYEEQDFIDLLAEKDTDGKTPIRILALQAAIAQKDYYQGTPAFLGSNETRSAVGQIIDDILALTPKTIDEAFTTCKTTLFMYL